METQLNKPLRGTRVLDLTRLLPGPTCTLLMADLGADVLKVEDTELGDYARWIPPLKKKLSYLFLSLNRNKKSLALNLRGKEGQEIFYQLVRSYDVIIESFRPGVTKKLGIDYETIRSINPKIIYCSLTGYGQTGPYKDRAGHDINYLGYSGLLDKLGKKGGSPILPNFQMADLSGGALMSLIGILAALNNQKARGEGQYLDISMLDGLLSLLTIPLSTRHLNPSPQRGEDILSGGSPCYQIYGTSDGRYMTLGAIEKKFWDLFCQAIERPDLIEDHLVMGIRAGEVENEIKQIFKSHPQEYWVNLFAQVDCCCTPVLTLEETLQDPHIQSRTMVISTNHPQEGEYVQFSTPIKMSNFQFSIEREAPLMGEHSEEILQEIGFSGKLVDEWLEKNIIKSSKKKNLKTKINGPHPKT